MAGTTQPGRSEGLWAQVAMLQPRFRTQRRRTNRREHRRRAEQTQCWFGGMAGSALTSATLRKASCRTTRCLKLEAVLGKTRRTEFREGGWKRGPRRNCDPTLQPKGQGWKPSA